MDRTRKASWSFLSGLAFAGITAIVGLAATPLLLRWLGEERFGAFRAASDWTGHLTILELGFSGALLPILARAVARGDGPMVRVVLRVGARVYLGVALLVLAAGAGLALIICRLVPVTESVASDLQGGCWLGLAAFFVLPLSPFRALAEADQRGYLINLLLILQTLVITGLGLALAWGGWGITGQFLAASVGVYPFLLLIARDGLQRYPKHGISDASRPDPLEIRREMCKLNGPSLIRIICGRLGLFTDNLLIAYFMGPAMVAPFFLTQRMAVLAQSQLQGIGNAGWAGLVELAVKGKTAIFHRRLIELSGLVTVVGIAIMVPLAGFNKHFVSLWVGAGWYAGEWVTVLASVNAIMLAIFSLWGWVLSGAGHVARVVPGALAAAGTNVAASIAATLFLGMPGPLIGTLTAFVLVNSWFYPLLLKRLFHISLKQLALAVALPLLLGIPYSIGVWWFARALPPQDWIQLAVEMAGSSLLYLALAWVAVFNAVDRAEWLVRIRSLLRLRQVA